MQMKTLVCVLVANLILTFITFNDVEYCQQVSIIQYDSAMKWWATFLVEAPQCVKGKSSPLWQLMGKNNFMYIVQAPRGK